MEKKTITLTYEEKQMLDKPWPGIRSPYRYCVQAL